MLIQIHCSIFIFIFILKTIQCQNLYPYGVVNGDIMAQKADDSIVGTIRAIIKFPFLGSTFENIHVSSNGLLVFDQPIFTQSPPNLFPNEHFIGIAAFWEDINTFVGGKIFFRQELLNPILFSQIRTDVQKAYVQFANFKPTWALIATWEAVAAFGSTNPSISNTFQVVIASDGIYSFTILNYGDMKWSKSPASNTSAIAGLNHGPKGTYYNIPTSFTDRINETLQYSSFINVPGKWVFRTDITIRNEDVFYILEEDNKFVVSETDDLVFGPIQAFSPFPYFGTVIDKIYVNSNGLVTFNKANTNKLNSVAFPVYDFVGIAAFWADIDTTSPASISFSQTKINTELFNIIATDTNNAFPDVLNFQPKWVFLVTWNAVSFHGSNNSQIRNTFQAAITSDGIYSFLILNYGNMMWSKANQDKTQAITGFGNGLNGDFYTIPGSGTDSIKKILEFSSNMNFPGKSIYRIDTPISKQNLYPFGQLNDDSSVPKNNNVDTLTISTKVQFPFGGQVFDKIYLNPNGLLTFNKAVAQASTSVFFPMDDLVGVAVFWARTNIFVGGNIHFREIFNNSYLLERIAEDIRDAYTQFSFFKPTWAFIATWDEVAAFNSTNPKETNTFQVVIASDSNYTFTILNYGNMMWSKSNQDASYALAGLNSGLKGMYNNIPGSLTENIHDILKSSSNVNVPGRWVFYTDVFQPKQKLLPYGQMNGDNMIPKSDDLLLGPIKTQMSFPFFGQKYDTIFVSTNGYLTFNKAILPKSPSKLFPIYLYTIIACFWADISTLKGGNIYYREVYTNSSVFNQIADDVRKTHEHFSFFKPTWAFIATWDEVAASDSTNPSINNTFQVVIASDGIYSFTILNYGSMMWSGDNKTSALVGFNNGITGVYENIDGSLTSSINNILQNSKRVFRIDLAISKNNFYAYGDLSDDDILSEGDDLFEGPIITSISFPFFGNYYQNIYLSTNGLITFNKGFTSTFSSWLKTDEMEGIAAFWADINTEMSGDIYYRQIDSNSILLNQIANDVKTAYARFLSFEPTWAFIVTWDEVAASNSTDLSETNSFQVAIVSDGIYTFAVFIYGKMMWSGESQNFAGYYSSSDDINYDIRRSGYGNISDLEKLSNVNKAGKWIFRIDSSKFNLYPYGNSSGDNKVPEVDGEYVLGPIPTSISFPFFGNYFQNIFIKYNGLLSFNKGFQGSPLDFPIDGVVGVSPFWADINTGSGGIYYRQITSNSSLLKHISFDIRYAYETAANFTAIWAFIATWHEVSHHSIENELNNTFQAVITSDGSKTFAIFNYAQIRWPDAETNTFLLAGYDAGSNGIYYSLTKGFSRENIINRFVNSSNINLPGKWIFDVNRPSQKQNLYPYGHMNGDKFFPKNDSSDLGPISTTDFSFLGDNFNSLYVSTNGFVTFKGRNITASSNSLSELVGVAAFLVNMDIKGLGNIYYRLETKNAEIINQIASDIGNAAPRYSRFEPKWAFIATWDEVVPLNSTNPEMNNTFQVIIASDGIYTFTLFNYETMMWSKSQTDFAIAGLFSNSRSIYSYLPGSSSGSLNNILRNSTNTKIPGKWLFRADSSFSKQIFYPYGTTSGDTLMPKSNDNVLGPIITSTSFPFFGNYFQNIYISINGLITFNKAIKASPTLTAFPIDGLVGIAPFWTKINTIIGGNINYREVTTNSSVLSEIAYDINQVNETYSNFKPTWAFIATWDEVAAFNSTDPKISNTFQVVIASDGNRSFIILNYANMMWPTNTANMMWPTNALAGFDAGSNGIYFNIASTRNNNMLNILQNSSNVNVPGKWIFRTDSLTTKKSFYPFGHLNGDKFMPKRDDYVEIITTSFKFPFFGSNYQNIYLSTNGLITFDKIVLMFPLTVSFPPKGFVGIAPFWSDINILLGGNIYFRQTTNSSLLNQISNDVGRIYRWFTNFKPTWAFIATWDEVAGFNSTDRNINNTFQVVIASDGNRSFTIINYANMKWPTSNRTVALAGFDAGFDSIYRYFAQSSDDKMLNTLQNSSNTNIPGTWVIQSNNSNVQYYPYGSLRGDNLMPKNDDYVQGPIVTSISFPFFNNNFQNIYISINGLITFNKAITGSPTTTSFPIDGVLGIAAFWTNINTIIGGNIYYRQITNNSSVFSRIANDIANLSPAFVPTWAFIATWDEVSASGSMNPSINNTFQVVMASDGNQSFTIINYVNMMWPTNNATKALAGLDAGSNGMYYNIAQSTNNNMLNILQGSSNVNVSGKWIFRTDSFTSKNNLYPFGSIHGDKLMPKKDDFVLGITSSLNFPFFGSYYQNIFLSVDGFLTFSKFLATSPTTMSFPTNGFVGIAPFWANSNTIVAGNVYYRQITKSSLLSQIGNDITSLYLNSISFTPTWAFIATWNELSASGSIDPSINNTFQVVMASDGNQSFTILNYLKMMWPTNNATKALAGFDAGSNGIYYNIAQSTNNNMLNILQNSSNVNVPGKWIFRTDSFTMKKNFYPFGNIHGDQLIAKRDDFVLGITSSLKFPFFGSYYQNIFLSVDGFLTFSKFLATSPTTMSFPTNGFVGIAPFWANSNTIVAGNVYYRQITNSSLLRPIGNDITSLYLNSISFVPTWAFIATWDEVSASGSMNPSINNTFQVVMASDGNQSFTIINYANMMWPTNNATKALAGFDAGSNGIYYNIAQSTNNNMLNILQGSSNVNVSGKWIFRTDSFTSKTNLYPFGSIHGDLLMPKKDDFVLGITSSFNFSFFGSYYQNIFLSVDGFITFNKFLRTSPTTVSFPTDGFVGIAPFWANSNILVAGNVYFRQITNSGLLNRIGYDITSISLSSISFTPTWAFIATWDEVAAFGSTDAKINNTFQAVIASDGNQSFTMLIFDVMMWPTSSSIKALVGYDGGSNNAYRNIAQSTNVNMTNILQSSSNTKVPGKWLF